MRTIIAGTRTFTDYDLVKRTIEESGFEITLILCGMAKGVDTLGYRFAKENNIPVECFPAKWSDYGKSAGYKRNQLMAENADALIAITSGSPGTKHMIEIAKAKGLRVFVKYVKGVVSPEEKLLRAIFGEK